MVESPPNPNVSSSLLVSKGVTRFAHERSQARRFHTETLGREVNPEYCLGDFLQLVSCKHDRKLEERYGSTRILKSALAESSGVTGGYLVPAELRDDLMGDVAELSTFRPRAVVVPMSTATVSLPLWDTTTATSQGVPPFWGGMALNWLAEANTLAENEGKFRQLELRANLIGGTVVTSATLQQDARGLEAWLRYAFSRTLNWYEEYYFTNGNGTGQPKGLLAADCAISINRGTPNQYAAADGQKMFAQLYNPKSPGAVWLFSITAGQYLTSQTNFFVNGPMIQYGLPVYSTMHQTALGTKGDVMAVDLGMYVIGDRQTLEIDASPYTDGTMFKQNQWMWRVAERVDGQPLLNAAITVPDGAGSANTVSPVVILN